MRRFITRSRFQYLSSLRIPRFLMRLFRHEWGYTGVRYARLFLVFLAFPRLVNDRRELG